MDSLAYYTTQSPYTNPGPLAHLFDDLPVDIPTLRRVASGLVVHYRVEDLTALGIPEARVSEIDTRYAEAMLQRIVELDDQPLDEERPKQQRLVGCCRDFTVLFLAMLRHKGIPARGRVGFASYFAPGWLVDHEVAEVWDAGEGRWRLIDAELANTHTDPTDGVALDALDLPRDRFLTGGAAWRACRSGQVDPERFVVDPGLQIPVTRGWLQLRHNLVQDLAALNRTEMILWDTWGMLGDGPIAESEERLLDRIAAVSQAPDPPLADLQALYGDEPGLRVPDIVTSYNDITGEPRQVMLTTAITPGCDTSRPAR